jgi:hypothetical protein
MTNCKEQYIVRWLYNKMWVTGHVTTTRDQAIEVVNGFKHFDEKNGKEYKYRIIKQTIQEEIVYNEEH